MEKQNFSTEDCRFMQRAMELAERGKGFVNPNPLVGAVVVKDGKVIGEGWHEYYGGLHAERNAFKNCAEDPRGATLYVTLEPCCHYGKTPPCTEIVMEKKIGRVVVGLLDPNPLVSGKGIEKLRAAGIEVVTGVKQEFLEEQNRFFLKYIRTKLPWLALKTAMTLDGKIAAASGDSKWITAGAARQRVHQMRAEFMGIMVGAGTVKIDDPLLNCRMEGKCRQPVRIVISTKADISFDSQIIRTAREYPVLIAHTAAAGEETLEKLRKAGVKTMLCAEEKGRVAVKDLLGKLGESGIDSLLLEGGGELNYAFLRENLVDEVFTFIAPKLIGGKEAKTAVEGEGFKRMADAVILQDVKTEQIGTDFLIRGKIKNR